MVRKRTNAPGLGTGELMQAIHGCDVYKGFDFRAYPRDLTGWGGESPAFDELIRQARPRLIIEVGTWKGASAVSMAKAAKSGGMPTKIICIDTWLGALEFRMITTIPNVSAPWNAGTVIRRSTFVFSPTSAT